MKLKGSLIPLTLSDCQIVISSYGPTKVFEEEESVDESKEGSDKLSRTESSKSFESFGEEVLSTI